jgi:putative redox protein
MTVTARAVRATKAAFGAIAQRVTIGPHFLISDGPPENGGNDLGADPHELLDAALASCTAMTLHLYARRKGWALVDASVEVSHQESHGVYSMRRDIRLTGTLSAEECARLLDIANKCPVHRTLSGSFKITSQLVD